MLEGTSVPSEQQDEAVTMLREVTRFVSSSFEVSLPILVEYVRPILLPRDGCRPYRLNLQKSKSETQPHPNNSSSSSSSSSALYYDPFAAQRAKDKLSQCVTEVLWAVDAVCEVLLVLRNPLAVPLRYDAVSLILAGPKHIAYECVVEVPANSISYSVCLHVKPVDAGILTVRGIQIVINNAVYKVFVDANGKFPDSSRLVIHLMVQL
jgi:hypothetical protein